MTWKQMMYTKEYAVVQGSRMENLVFEPEGAGPHPGLNVCQHIPTAHAGLEIGHCWGGRVSWLGACHNPHLKAAVVLAAARHLVDAFALQDLHPYYGLLRPCAPHRYSSPRGCRRL